MTPQLRSLALAKTTNLQLPAPTCWLGTVYNSSPRGFVSHNMDVEIRAIATPTKS